MSANWLLIINSGAFNRKLPVHVLNVQSDQSEFPNMLRIRRHTSGAVKCKGLHFYNV